MKLWDKGYDTEKVVEAFTVGQDRVLDLQLARYDVAASRAHARMLHHVGLLTTAEWEGLARELDALAADVAAGRFEIEPQFEDVHSKIEHVLTERLGEAGKKIHTGRSRNDQVLVCLHLYVRDEIQALGLQVQRLFDLLLARSQAHRDQLMPGYTHLQVAMPSSFGLWFGAYAETLVDDVLLLAAAYRVADQNPLGSAAGYGSAFPLDREMTTAELGFGTMRYNVVAAQMSRGRLERTFAFALASLGSTLGRLAMDTCLYLSQNFGFFSLPDALTTGSSIMPHKKNPDGFELIRARCNRLQALPNELALVMANLPSGYHRDYQLLKEALLPAVETAHACLEMTHYLVTHLEVQTGFMDDERYRYLYTVEAVNAAVQSGLSFREAYRQVGTQVADGTYVPPTDWQHTHAGSLGNLCHDEITEKMRRAMAAWG